MIDEAPPAQWVQEMHEHFRRTGRYRASDIRRVMGDRRDSVKFGEGAIDQMAEKLE